MTIKLGTKFPQRTWRGGRERGVIRSTSLRNNLVLTRRASLQLTIALFLPNRCCTMTTTRSPKNKEITAGIKRLSVLMFFSLLLFCYHYESYNELSSLIVSLSPITIIHSTGGKHWVRWTKRVRNRASWCSLPWCARGVWSLASWEPKRCVRVGCRRGWVINGGQLWLFRING